MGSFNVDNKFYSYKSITGKCKVYINSCAIFFVREGSMEIKGASNKTMKLKSGEYAILKEWGECLLDVTKDTFAVLVISKSKDKLLNIRSDEAESIRRIENAYQVTKPWGREVWLTGQNGLNGAVLKYIEIKEGTKTSLQVHLEKYETNVLVDGSAIFRKGVEKYTGKNESYNIEEREISAITAIDVSPYTIHQVEAITDICIIEASTDHLDDVVRLKDDSGRGDGKIEAEHNGSK